MIYSIEIEPANQGGTSPPVIVAFVINVVSTRFYICQTPFLSD